MVKKAPLFCCTREDCVWEQSGVRTGGGWTLRNVRKERKRHQQSSFFSSRLSAALAGKGGKGMNERERRVPTGRGERSKSLQEVGIKCNIKKKKKREKSVCSPQEEPRHHSSTHQGPSKPHTYSISSAREGQRRRRVVVEAPRQKAT